MGMPLRHMGNAFLTWALSEGERPLHAPSASLLGERAYSTHWPGGWVGPRAGLVTLEKRIISCMCQELN